MGYRARSVRHRRGVALAGAGRGAAGAVVRAVRSGRVRRVARAAQPPRELPARRPGVAERARGARERGLRRCGTRAASAGVQRADGRGPWLLMAQYGQAGAGDRMNKCLADFDLRSLRRLERSRLMVCFGPALGLMGTLFRCLRRWPGWRRATSTRWRRTRGWRSAHHGRRAAGGRDRGRSRAPARRSGRSTASPTDGSSTCRPRSLTTAA